MTDTESALWLSIEADPTNHLVRGVYADWLDEQGREDEAAAVRATALYAPQSHTTCWSWGRWLEAFANIEPSCCIGESLFDALTAGDPGPWKSWLDYPTFRAAMQDLIWAWVAVHQEGVTV